MNIDDRMHAILIAQVSEISVSRHLPCLTNYTTFVQAHTSIIDDVISRYKHNLPFDVSVSWCATAYNEH